VCYYLIEVFIRDFRKVKLRSHFANCWNCNHDCNPGLQTGGPRRRILVYPGLATGISKTNATNGIAICIARNTCTVPLLKYNFGNLVLYILASTSRYCTFVCWTLFGRIKLIELYPPNKVSHTKVWQIRKYREPKSRIGGNSGFKYRHKFLS
jgi:hypothetical protein